MKISFILTLKNRINLTYTHKGVTHTLNLLGNNLNSLCAIITPEDEWEFVIVDFGSTDANVEEYVREKLTKPNMTLKVIKLDEPFSRGKGLNVGSQYATHDLLFCYDADMMIRTRDLFHDIKELVEEKGNALFPICWSYKNAGHTSGWKRDSGKGNVICRKSDFTPYIEKTTWGGEDDRNYESFTKKGIAVRTYYHDNFIHQWHPK